MQKRALLANKELIQVELESDDQPTITLVCKPLTEADMIELNSWARSRHIKIASESCSGLDREGKALVMETAMRQAGVMQFFSGYGLSIAATCDGMAYLLYTMAGKTTDYATILKYCNAPKNIEKINAAFSDLNNVSNNENESVEGEKETRKKRAKALKAGLTMKPNGKRSKNQKYKV